MVKLFKNLLNKYKNSRFLFPLTVFTLLFLCASLLVFEAEFSANSEFSSFSDGLWWTLITFSTTGYGDKVPVTAFGR
ncbi:MAG TPA: potassium channel family protein, partial [Spirochaetia bacterium]|nr:potassium channel family protein [Spirochaetia bacterium]